MGCLFDEELGNAEHSDGAPENESWANREEDLDTVQQTPAATQLPTAAHSADLLGLKDSEEPGAQKAAEREKLFHVFLVVALLGFGTYQSVLYFGHKVVPLSDFPNIVRTGHEVLSFKTPTSFKYAPVVGVLQASLSHLVGGQYPDLTAGWLLNAILHPLNLLLFWLVGREMVGRPAIWLALVASLNLTLLRMLTEPIVEIPLLFFSLATFYVMLKRSSWCYLLASITTMVRYEGAALIVAAFVMDMINRPGKKAKLLALLYSVLATVPLALWLLGTAATWQPGSSHYLSVLFSGRFWNAFGDSADSRIGILRHITLLWEVGFQPLLLPYGDFSESQVEVFWMVAKVVVASGFAFGCLYGLGRRQWGVLALLIFLVPYFLLHAFYPYPSQRFHMNTFWIALFLCCLGLQGVGRLAARLGRVRHGFIVVLHTELLVIFIMFIVSVGPAVLRMSAENPKTLHMSYVAMGLGGLISAGRVLLYGWRALMRELAVLSFVCLLILSNQMTLGPSLGDGQTDVEFKLLADWYAANAQPGEKMLTTLPGVVQIFAPKRADCILHTASVKAESPQEFVAKCQQEGIAYVAWDSRLGLCPQNEYYKFWHLDNVAELECPYSSDDYEYITQIEGSQGRFMNIFRLREPLGEVPIETSGTR